MTSVMLNVVTACVLGLLYLFVFRVLRAMWVGVSAAYPATGKLPVWLGSRSVRQGRSLPAALVVRSPTASQGRRHALGASLTIGRGEECTVTVDDTYSSHRHARVYEQDGQYLLEDLGSTNGTYLNRQKVSGALVVRLGDYVQIGATVFEVVA